MTPTKDQLRRSYAKAWLREYATPSALKDIADSMDDGRDRDMVCELYTQLTGNGME